MNMEDWSINFIELVNGFRYSIILLCCCYVQIDEQNSQFENLFFIHFYHGRNYSKISVFNCTARMIIDILSSMFTQSFCLIP